MSRPKDDDYERALIVTIKRAQAEHKAHWAKAFAEGPTPETAEEGWRLVAKMACYKTALNMYRKFKKNGLLELP